MKKLVFALILFLSAGCGSSQFLPDDFEIPTGFETAHFRLRPITVADAEKDYEAIMESVGLIRSSLQYDWPPDDFSLEDNRYNMESTVEAFRQRKNFTFVVVSLDESTVLGNVYINRGLDGPDAAIYMWVSQSSYNMGLASILEPAVRDWINTEWPFETVVYRGRTGYSR